MTKKSIMNMSIEKVIEILDSGKAPETEQDFDDFDTAMETAINLLKTHPDSQPNDPLTLEELREMDGEPVWLHTFSAVHKKTQIACWAILECSSGANAVFLRAGVNSRLTKLFCNYGERWLAYRRRPEGG